MLKPTQLDTAPQWLLHFQQAWIASKQKNYPPNLTTIERKVWVAAHTALALGDPRPTHGEIGSFVGCSAEGVRKIRQRLYRVGILAP